VKQAGREMGIAAVSFDLVQVTLRLGIVLAVGMLAYWGIGSLESLVGSLVWHRGILIGAAGGAFGAQTAPEGAALRRL
jgi:hypothetical protein